MGSSESELLRVCMLSHEHARYKSKLGPIPPGLDRISHKCEIAQAMTTTQHLVYIQHKDEWRRAQIGLCNYVELIDPTFRDAGGVD